MSNLELFNPRVTLAFEGMVALCVAEGKSYFDAGIIQQTNGSPIQSHCPLIIFKNGVQQKTLEGKFLRLVIGGKADAEPPAPGVELFCKGKPIKSKPIVDVGNRFGSDKNFCHVVDVEKKMHNNDKVAIKENALGQGLRVTGVKEGIFYTSSMTEVEVLTTGGSLGRVAFSAEVQISLTGNAVLEKYSDGNWQPVEKMTCDKGVVYEIRITNTCAEESDHPHCSQKAVVPFYNSLFDHGSKVCFKPPDETLTLYAGDPSTPQTGCPLLNFGVSDKLWSGFPS